MQTSRPVADDPESRSSQLPYGDARIAVADHSQWVPRLRSYPFMSAAEYIELRQADAVIRWRLLEPGRAAVVLPLGIEDQRFLARNRRPLEGAGLRFLVPELDVIQRFDDKWLFYRLMCDAGFSQYVPSTWTLDDPAAQFPCLLKKRITEAGIGSRYLAEPPADGLLEDPALYCLQQAIAGLTEYATHLLVNDGQVVRAATNMYVFRGEGGACHISSDCQRPEVRRRVGTPDIAGRVFGSIMRKLRYSGFCSIDYKLDAAGNPMIFEINPRQHRLGDSVRSGHFPALLRARVRTPLYGVSGRDTDLPKGVHQLNIAQYSCSCFMKRACSFGPLPLTA